MAFIGNKFDSERPFHARHCAKILGIHEWAKTDSLCVTRASRLSCAMKGVKFLRYSQFSEIIFVTCVSLNTSPNVPTVGLLWKVEEECWLSGRLEVKTPRNPRPFLFSSQRKGYIKLRNQRALQEAKRSFLRIESLSTFGNRLIRQVIWPQPYAIIWT